MKTEPVISVIENNICTITLNREEHLNAINADLLKALLSSLKLANRESTVRVIILAGAGRAFCSGADLNPKYFTNLPGESEIRAETEMLQEVTRQMLYSDKIVIGAIQGWAVGAGLEWAINCDFPIWAKDAKGFFPEAKWGLSVTGAVTTLLPAIVGPMKAKELILLGEKHSAEEFLQLGIAWKVVPNESLADEAIQLATKLSKLSARSLRDLKQGINQGSYHNLEKTLTYETNINVEAIMDPQTLEKIKTFFGNPDIVF